MTKGHQSSAAEEGGPLPHLGEPWSLGAGRKAGTPGPPAPSDPAAEAGDRAEVPHW